MKLQQLVEMGAAKTCEKCGKTMAANHYWYKGAWKCKGGGKAADEPKPETAQPEPAATQQPPAPVPAAKPAATPPQRTNIGSEPVQPKAEEPEATTHVVTQPLSIEVEVIDEAMPYLQQELNKINKVAAKVGAPEITTEITKTEFRDVTKTVTDDEELGERRKITYKQKYVTVKLTGNTPRIRSADGATWNFVGVITPSAQGRPLLKLAPSTEDTPGIRQMYSANPYYCDYCRKVRQRNETFIVQNGDTYRQVGRNCLRDFVGGADPQALLNYFSWFQTPEALEQRLWGSVGGRGDDEHGMGGGHRGERYRSVEGVLATTLAVVEVRGGYVSSKAESGRSTASDVRELYYGTIDRYTSESEKQARAQMNKLADSKEMQAKAKAIVDWFKSLPEADIQANTFFQNVKVLIDEGVVSDKMLGYIIGLYPAYQRATQQAAESKSKVRLIKEWPAEWGEGPKEIVDEHAVVNYVRLISGTYGSSQLVFMMLDNGYGLTWKYSGRNTIREGDEFNITGELHKDTYREPATIKFVPSRKWLRSAFTE